MARAKRRNHHTNHGGDHEQEIENSTHEAVEFGKRNLHETQRSAMAAFSAFGGPMARLMEHNRAMLQKVAHAVQEESMRFVNRRLEHTSHAIESSRDCQGFSGLFAVQQEWMLDFARDYAEQTMRFAEMMREIAEDGTAALSELSSEAMERNSADAEHRAAA